MPSRLILLCIPLFARAAGAQQTSPAQPSELVLRSGTMEVLLDFVVRDKHQKEVKDIRPEEVEIFEDGTRQTLKSFQYRTGKEALPVVADASHNAARPLKVDSLREINLVTMVFAGMSPQSRQQAAAMAHDFLREEPGPNTWIGIFTLKNRLAAVQTYTADLDLLNKAVDRAATGQYQQFAKENLELVQHINSLNNQQQFQPLQPGSAEERVAAPDQFLNPVLAAIDRMNLQLLFRQEGSLEIDALRALIREQAQFPGRKTVLFFSEGLVIPPDRPELLESVISEANRANLTFYTLDARGLSTVSNVKLSGMTYRNMRRSAGGGGPDSVNTDLQANSRHLATGTGGFAMDNSSDLRTPLRRVMEDIRSHYEVTYSPVSTNFDGHFRKLAVRLTRPGVTVQSRVGYYALPMVAGQALSPFEMAALKVLSAQPQPHAFDFHVAALRFGGAGGSHVYRVVASVPSSALRFGEESSKKTLSIHVSALGLIKDERGQVVRKVSKDLSFDAPADKRAELQGGNTILIMPLDLPAGLYHLETAVIDRVADRASVRRSVLVVPGAHAGCQLSDLVWVRRLLPAAETDLFNPLETPAGSITPAVDPVFAKSEVAHFYFVLYPDSGAADKPVSQMTVSRDGRTVAAVRLDLPEPNPDGSYSFLESLPTDTLPQGQYDVQVTASQQGHTTLLASQFAVQ
ncbi:MAG: VWA domain-containing protein [Bryobacteraceae bacterium]